jgi:hypothetical protein
MKLRRRRRYLAVWSSSAGLTDRYGTPPLVRARRTGRVRRLLHTGGLLTVIGLMGVVRVARPRRRLLTGLVLAALPVILRDSMWGLGFLLVFVLYLSALVTPTTESARQSLARTS